MELKSSKLTKHREGTNYSERIVFVFLFLTLFCVPAFGKANTADVPADVLAKIKHTMRMRPNSKDTLEDHINAYKYLKTCKPSNIPERTLDDMKRSVRQRHPGNYIMQKELYTKKVLVYYDRHNLGPTEDDAVMKLEAATVKAKALEAKGEESLRKRSNRQEKIIQTFLGPHNKITDLFEVGDSWVLWYVTKTDRHFTIKVYDDNGKYFGRAASCRNIESGIEFYKKGGNYFLKVESKGNWEVKIVEMELKNGKMVKTPYSYIKSGGKK